MNDRTIMVPTPGGRRPAPQSGAPKSYAPAPDDKISIKHGLNPIVNCATTLLTVAIKLRNTAQHANVPDLHKRLTEEIKHFEQRAKSYGVPDDAVIAARYLLCTVVDEIVLNTPWGASSGWSQHSLLSLFHHETFGGEKCFLLLQKLLESPGKNLDLLELYYLCLSLGFEGKYRLAPRGHEQLESVRENLYNTIENHRPTPEQDLSPHWQSDAIKPKSRLDFFPTWVVVTCFLAVLVSSYGGMRWWLQNTTEPVAQSILLLTKAPK
ncbi:type IVB secretion system protein IcmH/DotU [Simiduia sp. 21SJ11W-1]|uniref:type IVB secretion system protein IcmH/DotU n=1 Tax=Simiduia sp. 21SJ11W-1 TaxID=2909669 RepID=UPI00209E22E5|nr:type IVB secretion system protein IcmH/DotU [Simiduia sp. 21SJ11W-1]UTA46617.1 type IVB secretion system protein IcmH/DotU [Simiduia sp. 21SJ11W-1]